MISALARKKKNQVIWVFANKVRLLIQLGYRFDPCLKSDGRGDWTLREVECHPLNTKSALEDGHEVTVGGWRGTGWNLLTQETDRKKVERM